MHFKKFLAGASIFAILLSAASFSGAQAATTFETQTYSTNWDVTPTIKQVIHLSNGKNLLFTLNDAGDAQVGKSQVLVASTSDADVTKFDSSVEVVTGYYLIESVSVKQFSDGTLLAVYKGHKMVRLKDKVEFGYTVSTDLGATWSAQAGFADIAQIGAQPSAQPEKSVTKSIAGFDIREDSAHNALVLAKDQNDQYLGYYISANLTSPSWVLKLPAAYQYDMGLAPVAQYGLNGAWSGDKLNNVSFVNTTKGGSISLRTYTGFTGVPSLVGVTKVISAKAKFCDLQVKTNNAGDLLFTISYLDAKKHLKLIYRIYDAATGTLQKAVTKDLGVAKNAWLPSHIMLADDKSFAFMYSIPKKTSYYNPVMRTVSATGVVSAAVPANSVFGVSLVRADYLEQYLGNGNFAFVYYEMTENELGSTEAYVRIQRGQLNALDTEEIPKAATEDSWPTFLSSNGFGYFVTSDLGAGLANNNEAPNVLTFDNFALSNR